MSKAVKRMPLQRAREIAQAIVEDLRPACERIEIVGSIRRRAVDVGDIEILAIPTMVKDLLEQPCASMLDDGCQKQEDQGLFKRLKWGDKYRKFALPHSGIDLDLFICRPEQWGVLMAVRTGPASFSQRLVTQRSKSGLCPDHLYFRDWTIRGRGKDGEIIVRNTPEERDVFSVLGIRWVEPWERG